MRYELLFGYEGGLDEWLKAESDDGEEIATFFKGFISSRYIESPAHLYVWDTETESVYSDLYVCLHAGNNTLDEYQLS